MDYTLNEGKGRGYNIVINMLTYIYLCEKGDEIPESEVQPPERVQSAKDQVNPANAEKRDKSVATIVLFHMHNGVACSVITKAVVR
jgi:hypothetical protein